MIRKTLAVGIIFLFIITSIAPMVFGFDAEIKDIDSELEAELANLRYMCTTPDGFNEAEYESYKEKLLNSYSKDDTVIIEPFETVITDYSPATVTFGPMDSPWPMKCHDTHHTSQSPYSTADNPFDEIWKFECDWIRGGIIIGDDDTIYFGELGQYLYAINPEGTEKWRYETGGLFWIWSTPAIDEDGTVYVTSYDDYLHAVNPDGTLKWKFCAYDSISSSPAIGDDGTIYFGSMGEGCNIFAVNPNGTEKWHYGTGYYITNDPAIGDDGTVYIGSGDDYFYAMNPNGTLKWRFKTGSYIKGPASIADDGTVYVGSFDDYLYALYPNGTMKWKHNVDYGTESNPSIGSDGTIYCGGKYLYAINPDGTRKWTFDFGSNRHSHQSSPAISADGTIFIGVIIGDDDGGEIVAVNPDGTEKWREHIAENPTAPEAPTIAGETQGHYGESYEYTFVSNDPESQDIRYYIDWGDGSYEDWIGPYSSGQEITVSHIWAEENTYTIQAKAKDTLDVESQWGTLQVTMPVNQHSYPFPLLQRLLERFPNAFPILRNLLLIE